MKWDEGTSFDILFLWFLLGVLIALGLDDGVESG